MSEDRKATIQQFQVFLRILRTGFFNYAPPEGYETHEEYEKAVEEFVTGNEVGEMNNREWTPAYGGEYFKEKEYFTAKVKDIPDWDPRNYIPDNKVITQPRFISGEEVKSIFAAPLTGNHKLTDEEIKAVKDKKRHALSVLHFTEANPCVAHLKNMLLDRCQIKGSYKTPGNWERWLACGRHQYRYTLCLSKNEDWLFARFRDLKERTDYEHIDAVNRFMNLATYEEMRL